MNEKQKEIVDQYDVEAEGSLRNRGCLHIRTPEGLYLISAYYESPLRLAFECELQKHLSEQGFFLLDHIRANKEGGLLSYDKYRTPFVMKRAYEGKECSLTEKADFVEACANLARFHKACREIVPLLEEKRKTPGVRELFLARSRELKRIRNYIRKNGKRTLFELTFTECYEDFYEEAEGALSDALRQEEAFFSRGYGICHGAYHQHNVLLTKKGTATLNLGHFHYNQQIFDLYFIARKAMEKNSYSKKFLEDGLRAYDRELPLKREDYLLLYLLFSFPEKFWKISNQYYNGRKCWVPEKNLIKLKKVMEQNEKRLQFLKEWRADYLI